MKALVIAAAIFAAAPARADDPTVHASGGVELEGGGGMTSVAFRGQLLVGSAFGGGSVRPVAAVGGTIGAGQLQAPDPRGIGGTTSLSNVTYGPELQLGLQLEASGLYLFTSLAYLRDKVDDRLMRETVKGVEQRDGMRAALGINAVRALLAHKDGHTGDGLVYLALLPAQAELTYERDAGSTRVGATLSWGF